MYRQNKAMTRSLAIEQMVKKALELSRQRNNEDVVFRVPWSKFVFSTRNGKTYMPPSLQKGLDALPPYKKDGVVLTVRHTDDYEAGSFNRGTTRLVSPLRDSTIAHEVLHFVQFMGQVLLQLGQGYGPEWVSEQVVRDGKWVVSGSGGGKASRPYDTLEYGMPKKRSLTRHYRPASGGAHGIDPSEHGLRDIEFMSNALTVAHDALLGSIDGPPEKLAEYLNMSANRYATTTAKFTPQRLKDFYSAVWGFAVQKLVEHGAPADRYPPTPTPEIWPYLTGALQPERDRVQKEEEAYQRKLERKRRKAAGLPPLPTPPRPRPEARPPKPASKPAPKAAAARLTYKMDSTLGPRAFYIFLDGKPTGKYFFLEEKAQAHCAKQKAA